MGPRSGPQSAPQKAPPSGRIWITDFIRGIAIVMVVVFHLIFILSFFHSVDIDYRSGFWFYEGRIAAILFMGMVGVVTAIIAKQKGWAGILRINVKRGLRLIGIGMLITVATLITFPAAPIWFGILHLMGVSLLLGLPLAKSKWLNLIVGALLIYLGQFVGGNEGTFLTLPFGIKPPGFASLDYYPLIPWMGVIVIGNGLGNILYKYFVQLKAPSPWQKGVAYLGKQSLWIYLIHPPLFMGILWMIFR